MAHPFSGTPLLLNAGGLQTRPYNPPELFIAA